MSRASDLKPQASPLIPPNRTRQRMGRLVVVWGCLALLAVSGCSLKPGYVRGAKSEVPHRWKVEKIEPAGLSNDQRAILDRRGPPAYVRFFREADTREPVHEWIYIGQDEGVESVWFTAGRRVEAVAVDSDTSAFRPSTRRYARTALLVGTGAAIVPIIFLLADR